MTTIGSAPTGDGEVELVESGLVAFLRLLADAPDGDVIASAAARGLLTAWGPDLVTAYLIDDAGQSLEVVANYGLTDDQLDIFARVPLDVDIPITRLYLYGYDHFLRVAELAEDFPLLAAWAAVHPHKATAEVVGLPLRHRGRTIGVVSVSFPDGVEKTWRLRVTLEALANALSVWAAGLLAARPATSERRRRESLSLSARQTQVLALVRGARTNAEIAGDLGVSISTVKGELAALFRLLGAEDREDLVEKADRAGV